MSVEQHTPGEELAAFDEEVDGVPVLADVRTVTAATTGVIGAAQAVAVAATSFAAGAATLALVRRHGVRKQLKRAASHPPHRGGDALEIVASRRFMVDIHLLDKPGR
jgi:anti-sigma factor RsiW